jgi:hypothetical protein
MKKDLNPTIDDFQNLVHNCIPVVLEKFGEEEWFNGQPQATALSVLLMCELAHKMGCGQREKLILTGSPHSKDTKSCVEPFAAKYNIDWVDREFIIDFFLERRGYELILEPLVACESEVHGGHGVDYNFNFDFKSSRHRKDPVNGYVWDFRKLLLFPAPNLMFIARVNRFDKQMSKLQETLKACAHDYKHFWCGRKLLIVLLPTAKRQKEHACVGIGLDGELGFRSLS